MAQMQRVGKVATSVFTDKDGYTNVVFHKTPVVSFDNKEIILDSGGWLTNTTKTRMNQASNEFRLGFTVFQSDYAWFVDHKGKVIPFKDGMVLRR